MSQRRRAVRPRNRIASGEAFEAVCRFVERQRREFAIPGAALGIHVQGKDHVRGFGVARADAAVPLTPRTLCQIGSVSKTFVCALLMRLAEQGRVDLDRPVARYLDGFRLADSRTTRTLTLRHILTHAGGWPGDYFDDTGRGDDALARIVGRLARLPQQTPVGMVWAYNNSGFYIGGRVIERVTGRPFESAIAEGVFRPLGMSGSFYFAEDVIDHPFASGHNILQGKARPAVPWAMARSAHPAGGVVSNVVDLLRFARAHLRGSFLSEDSRRQAFSRQSEAGCGIDAMGLAWMLDGAVGAPMVWHGGATNGQVAHLGLLPDRGFAFVLLANANNGGGLVRRVEEAVLREFWGLGRATPPAVRIPSSDLSQYCGRYDAPLLRLTLTRSRNGLLMRGASKGGFPRADSPPLPSPPPARLEFLGRDRVRVVGASGPLSEGDFLRDRRGQVAWFRMSGRLHSKIG